MLFPFEGRVFFSFITFLFKWLGLVPLSFYSDSKYLGKEDREDYCHPVGGITNIADDFVTRYANLIHSCASC